MPVRTTRKHYRAAIIVVAILLAASNGAVVAAQTLTAPSPKPGPPPSSPTMKSAPKADAKTCSKYGAGFALVPGSDVCVKIGGSVTLQGAASK